MTLPRNVGDSEELRRWYVMVRTSGSTREGSENHFEGKGTCISVIPVDPLGFAIDCSKNRRKN